MQMKTDVTDFFMQPLIFKNEGISSYRIKTR